MQGQFSALQQQQATLAQRSQELQSRASSLDTNNQDLERLLAQSRQEARVLQDQLSATREQLQVAASQAAQLKAEYQDTTQRAEALTASLKKRTGAAIGVNNSLQDRLPQLNIPGVQSRVDGDVIRVEIPVGRLFDPGSARPTPQAAGLVDHVASELLRVFPQQIIGIEGHTDGEVSTTERWSSPHHLSIARSLAIYDLLVSRGRLPAAQLFVVGHGANHPIASSGTTDGQQRNRRIELVVYPERVGGR